LRVMGRCLGAVANSAPPSCREACTAPPIHVCASAAMRNLALALPLSRRRLNLFAQRHGLIPTVSQVHALAYSPLLRHHLRRNRQLPRWKARMVSLVLMRTTIKYGRARTLAIEYGLRVLTLASPSSAPAIASRRAKPTMKRDSPRGPSSSSCSHPGRHRHSWGHRREQMTDGKQESG
jgi:hypothetical protein